MEYFKGCSELSEEHLWATIASWNTTWLGMFLSRLRGEQETLWHRLPLVHDVQQAHYVGSACSCLFFFPLIITFNLHSTSEKAKKCFKLFYSGKTFFSLFLLPNYFKGHCNYIRTLWSWRSQKHLLQICIQLLYPKDF